MIIGDQVTNRRGDGIKEQKVSGSTMPEHKKKKDVSFNARQSYTRFSRFEAFHFLAWKSFSLAFPSLPSSSLFQIF